MIAMSTRTLYFNWNDPLLYRKSEKSSKGGGIVTFIHDSLLYKLLNGLSIKCEDIESLSIEILNSQTRNIIFNRPPDGGLTYVKLFSNKFLSDSTTVSKTFFSCRRFQYQPPAFRNEQKSPKFFKFDF